MADKQATLTLLIKNAGSAALDAVSENFDKIKTAALSAFAIVSAVVVKATAEFKESQQAQNALSQAMIQQGIYSKQLADQYKNQADELQRVSTFDDAAITKSQAILQAYVGQRQVTKELVQATADLAAAKNIDLASAADLVGKTIGTETNALSRQGIQVSRNVSVTQKYSQVVKGLNDLFGGQAEAATQGLGAITQLTNVVNDLFKALGEQLAPVISLFSRQLIGLGTDSDQVNPKVKILADTIIFLTKSGVVVAAIFSQVAKTIGTELGTAIGAVIQIIHGQWAQAWETLKTGVTDFTMNFVDTWRETSDQLSKIDSAYTQSHEQNLKQIEKNEQASLQRRGQVAAEEMAKQGIVTLQLQLTQQQREIQLAQAGVEDKARVELETQIAADQEKLNQATTAQQKLAIMQDIYRKQELLKEKVQAQTKLALQKDTFATIATLSQSNNSTLAAIGKAAAITQIAIETPVAIAKALAAFPPPFNFIAAGLVGVAMAEQAAAVAGVQLAEGGIVKARPGGVQATIGEGGQDEMVIPLDRAREFGVGGGGGTTIVFQGPVLGDANQARQHALMIDQELLKLRRNNESVAFDSGVI